MKLNKKTERLIKRRAAELKKLYETPNPEVDKIISELRAEATKGGGEFGLTLRTPNRLYGSL